MTEQKRYRRRKNYNKTYPDVFVEIIDYDATSKSKYNPLGSLMGSLPDGEYKRITFYTGIRKKIENGGYWHKINLKGAYYVELDKYTPETVIDLSNEFHAEVYKIVILGRIRMSEVPREIIPGAIVLYLEEEAPEMVPVLEMLGEEGKPWSNKDIIITHLEAELPYDETERLLNIQVKKNKMQE